MEVGRDNLPFSSEKGVVESPVRSDMDERRGGASHRKNRTPSENQVQAGRRAAPVPGTRANM